MSKLQKRHSDISKHESSNQRCLHMYTWWLKVILGGGRRAFLPVTEPDPETNAMGVNRRLDGQNLVQRWNTLQMGKNKTYNYVWRKQEFDAVDPQKLDYLLGESIRKYRDIFSIILLCFLGFFSIFDLFCNKIILFWQSIIIFLVVTFIPIASCIYILKNGLATNSY